MKTLLLTIALLLFSFHAFSQQIGNQGSKGNGVGNDSGRGLVLKPYELAGREAIKKPLPKTKNCQESGRVIMDIVVDKNGKVLEAKLGRGSTTNSPCLVDASKEAALKTKWSKNTNGLDKQNGKITYLFKIE
jgi:hypothetical protein